MNWIKRTALAVIFLIPSIVLLEGGSYFIWRNIEKTNKNLSGQLAVRSILKQGYGRQSTIIPNPYSLYWNNPDFDDPIYGKQFNSGGYRSEELLDRKSDTVVVLALGGSTTNMWPYIQDRTRIWTFLLEEKLSLLLHKDVRVINAGLPFGTTAELLSHYIFKGKYLRPNYVIYHGGGNDAMPLMFPDYKTDYSHVRWSTSGISVRSFFKILVERSYFVRLVVSSILLGDVYNGSPSFSDLNPDEALKRVRSAESIAFRENLQFLAQETGRNGQQLFLIGFLQAAKSGLTKNRPDLRGLEESLLAAVDKHDSIMSEIAQKYDSVSFLKLDKARFDEEWFQDNCHLNEIGEQEKAQQIFDFLKEHIKP